MLIIFSFSPSIVHNTFRLKAPKAFRFLFFWCPRFMPVKGRIRVLCSVYTLEHVGPTLTPPAPKKMLRNCYFVWPFVKLFVKPFDSWQCRNFGFFFMRQRTCKVAILHTESVAGCRACSQSSFLLRLLYRRACVSSPAPSSSSSGPSLPSSSANLINWSRMASICLFASSSISLIDSASFFL